MFEFFVTTYGNKLIGLAILALFGCLGYAGRRLVFCKVRGKDDNE